MANWKEHANRAKNGAQRLAAGIKQKSRYAAVMNRLRTVIRCQEQAAEKEYLALGRYYYNALRDRDNPVSEEHCQRLDRIQELLDGTLKSMEEAVREHESASIGIIGGADGPTAVYTGDGKKQKDDGTLFHFGGGPIEITVKKDVVYHPEDEDSEEIDLSDVESFDHDPMPEEPAPANVAETVDSKPDASVEPELSETKPELSEIKPEFSGAKPEFSGAELDENDSLPFEG